MVDVLNRRQMLAAGAMGAAIAVLPHPASAQTQDVDALARELMGKVTPKEGKVRLKIKEVPESGVNEPIGVSVDSPMLPNDYVAAIHVLAEGNPYPVIASWYLTPRSGRAEVNFRLRLAKSQVVRAYAVTSDGQVWVARQEVKVTIGGCGG
ncbi:Predicted secreted protein (fragment) [Candidatus Terasakiella magnetica]